MFLGAGERGEAVLRVTAGGVAFDFTPHRGGKRAVRGLEARLERRPATTHQPMCERRPPSEICTTLRHKQPRHAGRHAWRARAGRPHKPNLRRHVQQPYQSSTHADRSPDDWGRNLVKSGQFRGSARFTPRLLAPIQETPREPSARLTDAETTLYQRIIDRTERARRGHAIVRNMMTHACPVSDFGALDT